MIRKSLSRLSDEITRKKNVPAGPGRLYSRCQDVRDLLAGDVIVASTHDTGSGCTMIAHSMSNISTILAAAAAGHRRPALHPRRAFSRRHGSG